MTFLRFVNDCLSDDIVCGLDLKKGKKRPGSLGEAPAPREKGTGGIKSFENSCLMIDC